MRTPVKTRIGDPVTADLCSVVGHNAFQNVQASREPVNRQYLPGCELHVASVAGGVYVVGWLSEQRPLTTVGRTVRHASGFPVYAYPYANDGDECPRYVLAGSFQVEVRVFPDYPAHPSKTLACGVTDDMTRVMAAALRKGTVGRLALSTPSITRFDACKVARAARVDSMVDGLSGAQFTRQMFGEQCTVTTNNFDVTIRTARNSYPPLNATSATVGGHSIYLLDDTTAGKDCGYDSSQSGTDRKYEDVVVFAIAESGTLTSDQCHAAEQVLSRYLDTAGLR